MGKQAKLTEKTKPITKKTKPTKKRPRPTKKKQAKLTEKTKPTTKKAKPTKKRAKLTEKTKPTTMKTKTAKKKQAKPSYGVKGVIARKLVQGQVQYQVQWQGGDDRTWETRASYSRDWDVNFDKPWLSSKEVLKAMRYLDSLAGQKTPC